MEHGTQMKALIKRAIVTGRIFDSKDTALNRICLADARRLARVTEKTETFSRFRNPVAIIREGALEIYAVPCK